MKIDLYKKVKKFVIDSFIKAGSKIIKHHPRTAYWVKKLRPDADEALLIAAVAHDIGRGFTGRWEETLEFIKKSKKGALDKRFLENHQKRSAEIIGKFLEKEGGDKKLIKRVKMLVSKHEIGGNKDQNLLKDADSLSFFENNIDGTIEMIPQIGKEKVREKINWMYNRITSRKAKQIAKPWYQKAIKKLTNQPNSNPPK